MLLLMVFYSKPLNLCPRSPKKFWFSLCSTMAGLEGDLSLMVPMMVLVLTMRPRFYNVMVVMASSLTLWVFPWD